MSIIGQPLKLVGQERLRETAVEKRMQVYCMRNNVPGIYPEWVAGGADGLLQTIALSFPAVIQIKRTRRVLKVLGTCNEPEEL